mgnify:CR=1 FL=1
MNALAKPMEAPSGTVALLFTDIQGSARLLHELGDQRYAGSNSAAPMNTR